MQIDTRSRDYRGTLIASARDAKAQDAIGTANIFMPEQAWMMQQAETDTLDTETKSEIMERE